MITHTFQPFRLSEVGLIVLLPDMMVQDAWADFAARLADTEVLAISPIQLTEQRLARLYARHRLDAAQQRRLDGSWITPRLVTLDLSVAVLVGRRGAEGLSAELNARKGGSPWWQRQSHHLRRSSPLSHRGMSLFHTPTDDDDLRATAPLLFPGGVFQDILCNGSGRNLSWSDVKALRGYVPPDRDNHSLGILTRLLVRGLTLLAVDALLQPQQHLRTVALELERLGETLGMSDPESARCRYEAALAQVAEALGTANAPSLLVAPRGGADGLSQQVLVGDRRSLLSLLRLLCEPSQYGALLFDHCRSIFARNALGLTDWELHQTCTALVFYDEAPSG